MRRSNNIADRHSKSSSNGHHSAHLAVAAMGLATITSIIALPSHASAQATSPAASQVTSPATRTIDSAPKIVMPSVPPRPKRGASLRDAEIGKRALQLSPVQERAMAAVRARYSLGVQALVARLNALVQQQATTETVKATEDTLRHVIETEHAALDSLISPDQRQRFVDAMRRAHDEAPAPPPRSVPHTSPVNH